MAWIDEVLKEWQIFNGCITPYNTLELIKVLQKGVPEEDKPTSQPSVQDGDIMKAAESRIWVDSAIAIKSRVAVQIRIFAQAIEAEIKSVRSLFRNHEERIVEVEVLRQEIGDLRQMHKIEHDRAEGNLPYMELKMQTLERKVEELECEIEKAHNNTAEDDSRISALEQKTSWLENFHQPEEVKSQPKGRVARDKKGYKLIPGSVVEHATGDIGIFYGADGEGNADCHWILEERGRRNKIARLRNLTRLFDLPFLAINPKGSSK